MRKKIHLLVRDNSFAHTPYRLSPQYLQHPFQEDSKEITCISSSRTQDRGYQSRPLLSYLISASPNPAHTSLAPSWGSSFDRDHIQDRNVPEIQYQYMPLIPSSSFVTRTTITITVFLISSSSRDAALCLLLSNQPLDSSFNSLVSTSYTMSRHQPHQSPRSL